NPAKPFARRKTHRCCGIRRREISIKVNGFVIPTEGFIIRLSSPFVYICQSTQKEVIGIEAFGWFAPGTFNLCLFEPRRDCSHHTCRHLVLQLKDILNRPFEAICPKMCPG